MSIILRHELPADVAAIETVTVSAFLNAVHTRHTEQHIVARLRTAGKLAVSLVAEADGAVIGHVAMSPVSIEDGTGGWFGLGPVSVLPQHQRKGIGSRLIREALTILRARGAGGCVVLGDPKYYGRFGFRADHDLVLAGVPPEYFQAISFGSSTPRGIVQYHEAFDA